MKGSKNSLIVVLMIGSIALLIVLQVLWIHNSYEKAFLDFRRDANLIFKNTLLNLRNQLWTNNMVEIADDSLRPMRMVPRGDSALINLRDSASHGAVNEVDHVYIAGTDPRQRQLTVRSRVFARGRDSLAIPRGRSFVIRLDADVIQPDTLREKLTLALKNSAIDIPFRINPLTDSRRIDLPTDPFADFFQDIRSESGDAELSTANPDDIFTDSLKTDAVRVSPTKFYDLTFYNLRPHLIKHITPQIFFALLLTLMVTAAFAVLYRTLRAQQKLTQSKNDFINNVTHELKTPVATVSVAIEALKNFNAADDPILTKEYLNIAQREVERLNEMTDRILKTSVLEENVVSSGSTTDLQIVVKKVIDDKKIIFDQYSAKVTLKSSGTAFDVHGDSHQLYQMVENLVDNALKYSEGNPIIELMLSEDSKNIMLSVKDEGIGIPVEYHQKIFDKFFRVATGDVHNVKGYGLGLSYVYNLVTSLNGDVLVESESGKGSKFILRFPKIRSNKV